MCVGIETLAGLGDALTGISTVAGMAAANQQAKAAQAAYNSQAEANEANAKIADQQAKDALARSFQEEQQLRQRAARFKSSQKAEFAASGIDAGSGSALDVLSDTAYLSELDSAMLRYNAGQEAFGFRQQANNYRYLASADRAVAANARSAGRIGAFTTLITGATTLADRWNQQGKYGVKSKSGFKSGFSYTPSLLDRYK